ncbi:MAG: putative lipid II flippase FtsW [Microbacteriaceae bacterium]
MATNRPQRSPQPRAAATSQTGPAALVTVRRIFAAETGNYFLLLGVTVFLVIFGLVMVLSASSIESTVKTGSAYQEFSRQGLYAMIGIPLMLIVSRLPTKFWRKWAWLGIGVAMSFQLLVFTPLGYGYGGNRNWVRIGESFSVQPSELVKLALIIWIAHIITAKAGLLHNWRHVALPIGPVSVIAIGLILVGNDLGTAMVTLAIVLGCLFFAGVRLRLLGAVIGILAFAGLAIAFASPSRTKRIAAWVNGCSEVNYIGDCWQSMHGMWALASGGVFGSGLGNSKAKWSWLPEAQNDFIFAIIGEELGLIGAVVVLLLFVVLAIAFVRIIRSIDDPFGRIITSGVLVWVVGQALVNIAVVLGLLPVLGVPLPLISAGGSALISTLIAIGVVLSFARNPTPKLADGLVEPTPAERSRRAATQRTRPIA